MSLPQSSSTIPFSITAVTRTTVTAVIGAVGPLHWTFVPPKMAVMKECPDSCGLCSTVCQDHDESCKGWAKGKECETNKAFMYRVCPASCGICQVLEGVG